MSKMNTEIEARITEAISTILPRKKPSVSKLTHEFAVLYSRSAKPNLGRRS